MVEDLYKQEIATLRRLLEGDDGVDGLQQILDKAENDIRNSNIQFTHEPKTKPEPIFNKTPFSTSLVFEKKLDEQSGKLLTSSTSYFDKLLNGPDSDSFDNTTPTKIFDDLKEPAKKSHKITDPKPIAKVAPKHEKQKAEPVTATLFERLKTEPTSLGKKSFSSSSHNLETPEATKPLNSFMDKKLKPREYTRTPYSSLAPDTKPATPDLKNTSSTNALFEKYRGDKKVPFGGSMTLGRKQPEKESEFKTTSISFYNKVKTEPSQQFTSYKSEKKPEPDAKVVTNSLFSRKHIPERTLTFDKKVPVTESNKEIFIDTKPITSETRTQKVYTNTDNEKKPEITYKNINNNTETKTEASRPISSIKITEPIKTSTNQSPPPPQEFNYTSPNQSQYTTFPIRCTVNYFASPYRDQPTSRSNIPDYAKRYFQSLDQRQNGAYTQFFKYRNL